MAAPANLKERIAALQQRNVSPNTHQSAQAVPRGLPSPGSGGLRDKIAKFESKGGMPVPRASFAMGAPQLAENAPPRKRGELYGNRIPTLGRPSHPPSSTDESGPGPRKRCISTGTGLSASPSSNFTTDEPVPALPSGVTARRNSLAVNFGPGRSPVPEKPPEEEQAKDTEEASPKDVKETLEETLEQPPEDCPAEEELPKEIPDGQTPEDAPGPQPTQEPPKNMSPIPQESGEDALPVPQPVIPEPAPALPISAAPSPAETSAAPTSIPVPAPAETAVVSLPTSPPRRMTKPAAISVPNPTVPIPPSIPTPTPTTQSPPQSKPSFKAVVHRKVTEPLTAPVPSTLAPPTTSQGSKHRRSTNAVAIEVPSSPNGGGDLAVLLGDAALLEWRLTEGDGLKAKDPVPNTPTPTNTTFQTDPRHQSASTLTEHGHMPSVDSGSQSERSISIPSIREPLIDGEIPEGEETDGRSLASTTFSQRSPSHRKYLSNIYRLTGRRSSSYMYPRDSMSVSSEDSSPVTTPSDNGKRKGFGIAWPSGSPKKGGPNVGRSSSFADKIFSRNRTKSNVSSLDQERSSLYGSSQPSLAIQPSLTISFPSELSPDAQPDGVDIGRSTPWLSPGDSNSEFSPSSSILDKDIFDAFPSVPQTLPPGFHLDAESPDKGRASTLPHARKQAHPRLSMV